MPLVGFLVFIRVAPSMSAPTVMTMADGLRMAVVAAARLSVVVMTQRVLYGDGDPGRFKNVKQTGRVDFHQESPFATIDKDVIQ